MGVGFLIAIVAWKIFTFTKEFIAFDVCKLGKMCEVNKCCCCVDLRTGAIVISILQLLGGAGCFGMGASEWPNILNGVVGLLAGLCLLFGAIKYHQTATLVYLVLDMIAIILAGVAMAVIIIVIGGGTATATASVSG